MGPHPARWSSRPIRPSRTSSRCYGAHALGPTDIVKLTTYVVAGRDTQGVREARQKYFGAHRPASTGVFVAQLTHPRWFIEVEAVAARPAPRVPVT